MKQTRGSVSKETVVLHQWGHDTHNFGFINYCKVKRLATIKRLTYELS